MDKKQERFKYFRITINGVWVDINEGVWFKNVHLFELATLLWVYQNCEDPFVRYAYNELKRRWDADKNIPTFIDLWECVKKKQDPLWKFALQEIFERSGFVLKPVGILKKSR